MELYIVGAQVAFVNLSEHEQQIWGECERLITSCIIYYNTMLSSNLLDYKKAASDVQEATFLKQVSLVAWQHINLYGRYEFRRGLGTIDIDDIVQELAQVPVRRILTE